MKTASELFGHGPIKSGERMTRRTWTLPCGTCGTTCTIEAYYDPEVATCPDCRAKEEQAEWDALRRKRNEDHLAKIVPPRFRATDLARLPCKPAALATVEAWEPTDEKPALLLHGASGRGKTRLMWLLLTRRILRGERPEVFEPGEFALTVAAAWRDGKAEEVINRLKHTPMLALDDIDKDKLTERAEEALFAVFAHRCDWYLPTVITTNANGDALAAKFTATAGGPAFVRRLREHSVIVTP